MPDIRCGQLRHHTFRHVNTIGDTVSGEFIRKPPRRGGGATGGDFVHRLRR